MLVISQRSLSFSIESIFIMLSDDFIQSVNTNMKVGVSQCEWASIFYRKTLPKQANISARSYSSDFVIFFK